MSESEELLWEPQPGPQTALLTCPYEDVLFGGARGGGKTDGALGDFMQHQHDYGRNASGIMFRKSIVELEDTIRRAHELYPPMGAVWQEQKKIYTFPCGAGLKFRYLERETDAMAYQGHAYSKILFEELGNWGTSRPIDLMYGALRSAYGIPCTMRATANPGGPGHAWVKTRYIAPAPLGYHPIEVKLPSGRSFTRCFIPSRLQDNRILIENDPTYVDRLYLVGSAALVKAWLEGDWDAVEGAYFDGWSHHMVLPPFHVPPDWIKFRSFDWGYAKPFSVGWWAIASGDPIDLPDGSRIRLPRGAMVRYREWYGCVPGRENEGIRLEVEDIADGILKRENEEISYGVADPAIFDSSRGPSIAERFARYIPKWDKTRKPVQWRRGENKRIPGWSQMRGRMRPDEDASPMIYVFGTCTESIRLIPIMQHDKVKPEDLDTESEDHCFVAGTMIDGCGPVELAGRLTRCGAAVVMVTFADGRRERCTPDHRFLTISGWVRAIDLQDECCYDAAWSQSFLGRFRNTLACAITGAAAISSAVVRAFIGLCGRSAAALSRRECTSITVTGTQQITTSATWSFSRPLITCGCTATKTAALLGQRQGPPLPRGTPLTLAGRGTQSTGESTSSRAWRRELRPPAKNAAGPTPWWLRAALRLNIALGLARLVRCVGVADAGKADVFCLSLDEGHFTIDGGIVVSNCADEWRYACMSRPMPAYKPQPKKWKHPLAMDNLAPIVVPAVERRTIL